MRCRFCEADTVESATTCAGCGAELDLPKGTLISGRYEVLRFIGDGGMGTVYLAHDRDLDEHIALKLLRSELTRAPNQAKRFRSEIKLARRVSHKNVGRIFDYGQDGGRVYITMAYVDGVDLKKTLRAQGAFPPEEAFAVATDVIGALQAVHDEGIVHRDLKTANVMRDRKGVVRLMDFGIAKDQGADATELTAAGSLIGSPEYMSPEQWQGAKADVRSDIYALGIVVYELFTGHPPFRADNVPGLMRGHVIEPPPLEGEPARLLPEPVRPILARALAKEPSLRFATATEMGEALRRARAEWLPAVEGRAAPTPPAPRVHGSVLAAALEEPVAESMIETLPAAWRTEVPAVPGVTDFHVTFPATEEPVAESMIETLPAAWRTEVPAAPGVTDFHITFPATVGPPSTPAPAGTRHVTAEVQAEASPARVAPVASGTVFAAVKADGRRVPRALMGGAGVVAAALVMWLLWPSRAEPPATPEARKSEAQPAASTPPPTAAPSAPPSAAPSATPMTAVPTAVAADVRARRSPAPPVAEPEEGTLQVTSIPVAAITIDGRPLVGSSRKVHLPVGTHLVRLEHAAFQPFQRAVRIRRGELTRLEIDLEEDAVKKR